MTVGVGAMACLAPSASNALATLRSTSMAGPLIHWSHVMSAVPLGKTATRTHAPRTHASIHTHTTHTHTHTHTHTLTHTTACIYGEVWPAVLLLRVLGKTSPGRN
jgi:hypothetical protein